MQPDLVFGRTVPSQSAELLDRRAPAFYDRLAKRRTDSERRRPEDTGLQGCIGLPWIHNGTAAAARDRLEPSRARQVR
jgi:hypothetical protein